MKWTEFSRKIRINASIETIYSSWSETSEMSIWFLKSAKILDNMGRIQYNKGDQVEWIWNNDESINSLEILEANGTDHISFSFGQGMVVSLKFKAEGKYTTVELNQSNIPTDDESKYSLYADCIGGWTFWLVNLKAYLEHGILLHDRSLGKREDLCEFCNS